MADTSAQMKAEAWVLAHGLKKLGAGPFASEKVKLKWGGVFKFDIVSADRMIVGNISTSSVRTAGDKFATAKVQKIKCDTLYLTNVVRAGRRVLVFTEKDMKEHFEKDVAKGRFPKEIELIHIALPAAFQFEVEEARRAASEETSPTKKDAPKIARVPKTLTKEKTVESKLSGFVSGNTKTTQIGYINRHLQKCGGTRGVLGSGHLQKAFRMTCQRIVADKFCGYVYGANGADVFQHRCPKCQGGAPGIPF